MNQRGREGILVVYAGGRRGATYPVSRSHGPAPAHVARETVAQLAAIHPHLERDFTGRAHLDAWVHNPWSRGSYAAFPVGSVHAFLRPSGPVGRAACTSPVRTGERAARELIA